MTYVPHPHVKFNDKLTVPPIDFDAAAYPILARHWFAIEPEGPEAAAAAIKLMLPYEQTAA